MAKVITEVPVVGDSRYKSWVKTLTGVDQSKTNGYAFEGSFLRAGRKAELEVGSYILTYGERGSRAHHTPEVEALRVEADGSLETLLSVQSDSWALDLRDDAAALFAAAPPALTDAESALVEQLRALPIDRRFLVIAQAE